MSHGASEVDETALSQKDNVLSVLEGEPVNLGLDVSLLCTVGFQKWDINFTIKMTNVTHDDVIHHGLKVFASDDVLTTCGGDENVGLGDGLVHGGDLVTFAGGLEGVDGVNLCDDDTAAEATERLGAALADITVSGDDSDLTAQHDVGGALDSVDEGFTATVQVVELGLGHTVVDVDGWNLKLSLLEHFVQVVDSGGGLL